MYSTPKHKVISLFGHKLAAEIGLGSIKLSAEELHQVRLTCEAFWGGRTYHVLTKNCNHFCADVALRLHSKGACGYNRPCAHQYVGKYQSCMVISGRLIVHAGRVGRVPSWVNRAAGLGVALLNCALASQACVERATQCGRRCHARAGYRYRELSSAGQRDREIGPRAPGTPLPALLEVEHEDSSSDASSHGGSPLPHNLNGCVSI